MSLALTLDYEQARLSVDRLTTFATYAGLRDTLRQAVSVGTVLEPSGNALILAPYALDPAWQTASTGNYAKLAKSAFTLSGSSADWEDRAEATWIGNWIAKIDSASGGSGVTTASYTKNQGFYVAFFAYGAASSQEIFRCGWHTSADYESGVGLRFYASGQVQVYKDGVEVAAGELNGTATGAQNVNRSFEVMLLPGKLKELIVAGIRTGGAFSAVFEDIADTETDPEITPAGPFWFEVPAGGTQVQIAPLKFPSSGIAIAQQNTFHEAPASSETLENISGVWPTGSNAYLGYGHPAYGGGTQGASASLVDPDGTTAFSPDGTKRDHRIKVTLTTSDQGFTPFLYGMQLAYPADNAGTDDSEEHDATASIRRAQAVLSVPEDPGGVQFDIEFVNPDALGFDVAGLKTTSNRPALLEFDGAVLMDGRMGPVSFDDGQWNAATEGLSATIFDQWRDLELYIYPEAVPLDNLLLTDTLPFIAQKCGIPGTDIDTSTSTFRIPFTPGEEFGTVIEAGDSPSDWLTQIAQDYAATWYYGFRPKSDGSGTEFFFTAPADLPSTGSVTLYATKAAAITAGKTAAEAYKFVYNTYEEQIIEPECTRVRVSGFDPRTGRPFQAFKVDTAAETVTTAPSSRPANWLGAVRSYALVNAAITSQAAVNEVCDLLYARLTVARRMAEITTRWPLQHSSGALLWRGDAITLEGLGHWRIVAFSVVFMDEGTDGLVKDCTYTLEKI
jgi:hypothetical protein